MEIKKPTLTDNQKYYANAIYVYLRDSGTYRTKEQICKYLGWEYPKMDRQLRDLISQLAKVKPIISTSDSRGYKLAQTTEDMEEVKHQAMELQKRANEIMARITPLQNFMRG